MPSGKFWTTEEEATLRAYYGKLTYRQMAAYLPRHDVATIRYKARAMKILTKRAPKDVGGVPMEKALTPAQCDKMRSFLRAWVHYGKTYGDVSATKFLQGWRENECGFIYANNRNKRVAGGQP